MNINELLSPWPIFSLVSLYFPLQQVDGYTAGIDYPAYETIPKGLAFSCKGRLPGYYADIQTRCQVLFELIFRSHFFCSHSHYANFSFRFSLLNRSGIGVSSRAQFTHFCALMERCSTKRIAYAIGGRM